MSLALKLLAQAFGKPRLAETVATKGINAKFLAVNALNFANFLLRRERSFAPSYVVMEPSAYCNLKCPYCYLTQEGENRAVKHMSLEFFRGFVRRNRRHLTHIHFGMWGEPLLNKDFAKMVAAAGEAGIKCLLITNGTLLTEDKLHAMGAAGLHTIKFSVDGLERDFEETRQVKWEKMLEKIALAASLKARYGYRIEIGGVEYKIGDKEKFLEYFADPARGVDYVYTQPLYYAEDNKEIAFTRPCYRPWHSMAVYADGDVSICCYDHRKEHVVGDAKTESLRAIFNGEKQRAVRRAFKTGNGIPNMCLGCNPRYR